MKKLNVMAVIPVLLFNLMPSRSEATVYGKLKGNDLVTNGLVDLDLEKDQKKALVVLFLSAKCPCSNSHIAEIQNLSSEFKDFEFVAVHSNQDEKLDLSKQYFSNLNLKFPVIQDEKAKLADIYKAYKTPHAFVVYPDGKIAYQGGVSSSHEFLKADKKYLRDALTDIQNKRPVKVSESRTLGCSISREE